MATIRDVAEASGVSITTASFAINNNLRRVNPETRLRVLEAARRLNYHPNAMARGLVQKRMYNVGVLMTGIEASIVSNYYASGILCGICAEANAQQYDVQLHTRKWENADVSAPYYRDRRTDGTLIIAPRIGTDTVSGLNALDILTVVVSAPTTVPGVPSVDVDNAAGARLAAEHLLALGHTRIAHLMGGHNQYSVVERRDAFLATLYQAGVPVEPHYMVGDSNGYDSAYATACALLRLPIPPTAIFATNDYLAVAVLQAAQDCGVAVPEQLSVVGFDDYPESSRTTPPLTTIRHPLWEVGRYATQLLIARISGEPVETLSHLLAPELILRATTGPPKG